MEVEVSLFFAEYLLCFFTDAAFLAMVIGLLAFFGVKQFLLSRLNPFGEFSESGEN